MAVVTLNKNKNNVLHLWHLNEKLLLNYEKDKKLAKKQNKKLIHTNSIQWKNQKKTELKYNEDKWNA